MVAFVGPSTVDRALVETGRLERRSRLLPSRLVGYHVLAMTLYAPSGHRELCRFSSEGLWAMDPSVPLVVPQRSAFSKARERVGSKPLESWPQPTNHQNEAITFPK